MAIAEHKNFDDVLGFLADYHAYGQEPIAVERIDTHAAILFLAGQDVYKLKRPVKLPYLDFSTVALRQRVLEREFDLNRAHAPQLYLGVVPITRSAEGTLAIDGEGEAVEWALHMRRFPNEDLLANYAAKHGLSAELTQRLAQVVARAHQTAPICNTTDGRERMAAILTQVRQAFERAPDLVSADMRRRFVERSELALETASRSLNMRAERGLVRRCHADLHLGNIALIDGEPVLFDALEFDEGLAQIDVLYDLAFLIMDMMQKGFRPAAQLLLNRYVQLMDGPLTLYGLAALPLFLALRAGIRAVVTIDRLRQMPEKEPESARREILTYVNAAIGYLLPPPAKLVAVGGFSGTGKTTLASAISHQIGAAPGALHLRSDVERKAMFGLSEHQRLGEHGYTPQVTAEVYASISQKAKIILRSGHSVVVDAVFSKPDERAAIARVAERLNVPFVGLWLTAPKEKMKERVERRIADASDATAEVVDQQLAYGTGPVSWSPIDAGGRKEDTLREARRILTRRLGALA
ncbi:AAA family ATPase [Rhodoligotrophos ferricapiens]|uniref:bifunctional aminoglycoside phosphotransferase/ATP-binding protein n=1 Tax=Rhodoligotrophos ferricapiens TaxID=3069264 RepID=UPI00315D9B62